MTGLLVALGAMVGAPLRYLTDRAIQTRHDSVFPWGTFIVNLTESLILGALAGAYSTFSYETIRLAEQRVYLYGRPQHRRQCHRRTRRGPARLHHRPSPPLKTAPQATTNRERPHLRGMQREQRSPGVRTHHIHSTLDSPLAGRVAARARCRHHRRSIECC
ncbi:fluoride efflux transporter FluC [Nocardia brasiliensis]|uniref:fluoride efflux transporter FluC n=1 Tax=Nocardia brasiliensis TaxID=37326 RepID=UPI002458FE26|nr:CrcB family protein [Nocardia brasiliensis]